MKKTKPPKPTAVKKQVSYRLDPALLRRMRKGIRTYAPRFSSESHFVTSAIHHYLDRLEIDWEQIPGRLKTKVE